ncbi:MAG TPA: Flp pilus assembly protein CpaB [Rhizomicrobium sp.]|jgi:pilus assembly protein CpaB|nr:Flp pilus assembly protein CpaB [Rhizomicrobium sp.]
MNMPRMLILALAAVAAGAAAFLARGMLGGGTPQVAASTPPPAVVTSEVLVASAALQPGQPLNATMVHWQAWPKASVDSSFITHQDTPNLEAALTGTVVRAPIVEGEPLTAAKFVHADAGGFMAATLAPGMRAVSIPITTESGAGGFILPNDRVDLLMTEQISDTPRRFRARIVLTNVLVLAMDQTFKQDNNQRVVLAKTATLELSSEQARIVVKAQAGGPLSLALRALGDNSKPAPMALNGAATGADDDAPSGSGVTVIRFGVVPNGANGRKD